MPRRMLILDIGFFEPRCGSTEGSDRRLFQLLEIVADANRDVLACGKVPPLYRSGVRYIPEPADKEVFMAIPAVLAHGGADCEDLAAWRVAELRALGIDARFVVDRFVRPDGVPGRHIRVFHSGRFEDPSARLGMGNKNFRPSKKVRVKNASSTIPLGSACRKNQCRGVS